MHRSTDPYENTPSGNSPAGGAPAGGAATGEAVRAALAVVNVQHSPIGAFASFTLGHPGAHGGLGLGLGGPAGQDVLVGLERAPGSGDFDALPFFAGAERGGDAGGVSDAARFQVGDAPVREEGVLNAFPAHAVSRTFTVTTDTWTAGDLTFTVRSPVGPVPDPADPAAGPALRDALLPAVLVELTVDNTAGAGPRRAFFGYRGSDPYLGMRHLAGDGLTGVAQGTRTAIVTDSPDARSAIGFDVPYVLRPGEEDNWGFGLGDTALLVLDIPAGQRRSHRFAVCFHTAEYLTSPRRCRFLYNRWYPGVEAVAAAALERFDALTAAWERAEADLGAAGLPPERAFQLAHAVRSYYGSTQALEDEDGEVVWVVNEGEFRMINTLDLTVDQAYFEARQHPWTLRNVLEHHLRDYSYRDRYGLSFTHDMGVANVFAPRGRSAYERRGLTDCFSYMTAEELANWVLAAGVYAHTTGDTGWLAGHRATWLDCLESLLARDPDGTGTHARDSDLVGAGAEITTYDSLDTSLGQARSSTYLTVKNWAAYRWLERTLRQVGEEEAADRAARHAGLAVRAVLGAVTADGTLPALLEDPAGARIVPVVEGLALAHLTGTDTAAEHDLVAALAGHLRAVLVPGRCLFDDGGWKLSSTSANSWLCKIYLGQFTARRLLGLPDDEAAARADRAHVGWLAHPTESRWAWSDQILAGVPMGSRYYPRGVTSAVWLLERDAA
ncbi:glycoside hydrolase family 52 protein [Streptacidiphilus sp. ASG 303]|uniref:glycoside hydrolase family 52 protein n=1 Tax=Streptacidiphilus sp. ASG 303 TaxID=2896847 RepID=UPI001E65A277|nr:glycoside hydrolase family 52 protein [Streptacidiphilus sp. ASG 303]MCD0483578.1 glycoside hydrolase family 52 protein [Streptacidiphilus sp. ASG 303]